MKDAKSKALSVRKEEGTRFHKERGSLHGKDFVRLVGKTVSKGSTGMNDINKSIDRHNHRARQKEGEAGSKGYRPYRRD